MYGDTLSERTTHLSHYNASHSCSRVQNKKKHIVYTHSFNNSVVILGSGVLVTCGKKLFIQE